MDADKDRTIIFEQFARKAKERIEARKKFRKEELVISGMDNMVMEIRAISDAELNEIYEFSTDAVEVDRYLIYSASSTLQEAARLMVADGTLQPSKEYKITEMFTSAERNFIAKRILTLSGIYDDAGIMVKETEEVKNS